MADGRETDEVLQKLKEAWIRAASELNFEIIFPGSIPATGGDLRYLAFLPEFGSAKGIFIGIYEEGINSTESHLYKWCMQNGSRCSFINPKTYKKYEKKYFIDTLLDWGFYGKELPVWAPKREVPWA